MLGPGRKPGHVVRADQIGRQPHGSGADLAKFADTSDHATRCGVRHRFADAGRDPVGQLKWLGLLQRPAFECRLFGVGGLTLRASVGPRLCFERRHLGARAALLIQQVAVVQCLRTVKNGLAGTGLPRTINTARVILREAIAAALI